MSLSDVWASDEEENITTYDKKIAEREWGRMNEIYGNVGYKDGIEEGKENTLQRGFDDGYVEGARFGIEFGRLRGVCSTILESISRDIDVDQGCTTSNNLDHSLIAQLRTLMNDLAKLTYDDVFTKDYFLSNYMENTRVLKDGDDKLTNVHNVQGSLTTKCSCKHLDDQQQKQQEDNNLVGCCQGNQEKCDKSTGIDNLDDNMSNLRLELLPDRDTLPIINRPAEKLLLEYRDKVSEILKKLGFDVDFFLGR
ncbi:12537_t:CDS:2 [Ambispora leptoticha]|uniref:Protein YAE1 n=1 Tax=Ambispora leptoticha TaxID=144679 RepID=A0A9N9FCL0_9GLOM|nr:12537_t:CDS:2 [Ambispora leptoticha]